jgi:glycosyltransferase involved in cell wall biosynthesis
MPRFSIVIPTLRRPDTLRHALATAVAQAYDDFEIVVRNDAGNTETELLVRELDDPRVRHFASLVVVPMTENWEMALANASGEFITFIGDDDGLFPDACRSAAAIFDRTGAEIVSWHPHCYYWPNYLHPELRNRLVATVDYDFHIRVVSSQDRLEKFYRFAIDYSRLPMIYNSFVRRSVVQRVATTIGRYFVGLNPDATSGIANAAHTSHFVHVSRPLSVTGLSRHSTGHNTFFSDRAQASADQVSRDFGVVRMDDRLVQIDNLQIYLASDMLLLRDRIPSIHDRTQFNFYRLIQTMAATINDRPDFYEDTLAAIRRLAERHAVDLADIAIPAPLGRKRELECGTAVVGPNRIQFVIDGNAIALANIADAIRLMQQFSPPAADIGTVVIRDARGAGEIVVQRGEPLAFGFGGNGVVGLTDGWGEPEDWGTWSISKRARIRLLVGEAGKGPIQADLRYRAFVHKRHPRLDITCRVGGQDIGTWSCAISSPSGTQRLTIPADIVPANGTIDLEFSISDPRSPAELGASSDARLLGIGVETLSFLA